MSSATQDLVGKILELYFCAKKLKGACIISDSRFSVQYKSSFYINKHKDIPSLREGMQALIDTLLTASWANPIVNISIPFGIYNN
jgi:hypothetical protein